MPRSMRQSTGGPGRARVGDQQQTLNRPFPQSTPEIPDQVDAQTVRMNREVQRLAQLYYQGASRDATRDLMGSAYPALMALLVESALATLFDSNTRARDLLISSIARYHRGGKNG